MKTFNEIVKIRVDPDQKSKDPVTKRRIKIQKSDSERMQIFGWASVAVTEDGTTLEDWQGDVIDPGDLENAAYTFVNLYREGGEMHVRGGTAYLIESVMFTKEKMESMGIPEGTLPEGWWVGFQVTDADVWEKLKDGTYSMFSVEGTGEREEIE